MNPLRLIWFALLTSIALYAVIAFIVTPVGTEPLLPVTSAKPVVLALHVAGLVTVAISTVLFVMLVRRGGPKAAAFIVRWALIESAAIFGLVCAFLERDARLALPLGALAVAAMLLAYPKREHFLTA